MNLTQLARVQSMHMRDRAARIWLLVALLIAGPIASALPVRGPCCPPETVDVSVQEAAYSGCCAANDDAPADEDPAPCRGNGHCPKPCCWTPPVLAIRPGVEISDWTMHTERLHARVQQIEARVVAFDLLRPPKS
jgi:hypothetical protein